MATKEMGLEQQTTGLHSCSTLHAVTSIRSPNTCLSNWQSRGTYPQGVLLNAADGITFSRLGDTQIVPFFTFTNNILIQNSSLNHNVISSSLVLCEILLLLSQEEILRSNSLSTDYILGRFTRHICKGTDKSCSLETCLCVTRALIMSPLDIVWQGSRNISTWETLR